MRELDLKLTGYDCKGDVLVKIDGKPVKFKKNESETLACEYQTENEKVKIEVFRLLNVGGFFWFVTQIFFFFITIFGLFGTYHKERCLVMDFEAEVELKEKSELTLRINLPKVKQRAVEIQTDLQVTENSNTYLVDEKAKKIVKGLKISKILLAVATVLAVVIVPIVLMN